jgi:hypothetical protein
VSRREVAEEQVADAPAPERLRAEAPRLLTLQRQAGNRAVGRILARLVATPDWSTKDKAEETAKATRNRLRTELLPHMVGHANALVRNTAEFFSGPKPLLTLDAITKRSDSDEKMRKPPAGFDATLYDVFFLGTSMDNDDYHQKAMTGTLSGNTMYLRGHDMNGTVQDLDTMAYSVVHEVSHFLVTQYGELRGTESDAASFDRYADEFRAYWIQPDGPGAGLPAADKAKAIREHLVGTVGDPASGYPELRAAYFKPGNDAFKAKIDALAGPIGFNVTNSLRLHRLWQMLTTKERDSETVGWIVTMVGALTPAERREARASSLIAKLVGKLGTDDAARVRKQLDMLISDKSEKFLDAVASGKAEDIKAAYEALETTDKGAMYMNAGFLAAVDRIAADPGARAAITALTQTGRTGQYDAMVAFIAALEAAKGTTATEVPEDITTAMGKLRDQVRWTFFLNQPAMKQYVEALPPKLANIIRERLRD